MEPTKEKIFVEHRADATIVTFMVEKILEDRDIKELEESIMSLVEQARRPDLVLDFGQVKFLSSAALGLLVKIHKNVRERKGRLQLCNIAPKIYEIFKITKLTEIFDIS